ncbi:MAG: thiolase C-terminal domain-containing protein [Candidatus Geothermincolia bacterium]
MRNVGIISVGYTPVFVSKRKDVNIPEMISEAVDAAFRNANLTPDDIDAITFGNMQTFEGVNLPHLWATEYCRALDKPYIRIATGGTTGMSTLHAAYYHVASGMHDVVMAVTWEKQSEGDSQVGLSGIVMPEAVTMMQHGMDLFGGKGMGFGGGGSTGAAAYQAMSYLHHSGASPEHIDKMAALERSNAVLNPYAHLRKPTTVEDVQATPFIAWPLRFGHTCPTSDGATVAILASEDKIEKIAESVAWINGVGSATSDPATGNFIEGQITDPAEQQAAGIAARKAYAMAGIKDPKKEIDMAEMYNGFAHQSLMWLEKLGLCDEGQAHVMLDRGALNIDGELPTNASGGVFSTNAIGASAMNRPTECALQIMRKIEGGHQIPKKIKNAVSHGWGGMFQYVTVTVLGDEPRHG